MEVRLQLGNGGRQQTSRHVRRLLEIPSSLAHLMRRTRSRVMVMIQSLLRVRCALCVTVWTGSSLSARRESDTPFVSLAATTVERIIAMNAWLWHQMAR